MTNDPSQTNLNWDSIGKSGSRDALVDKWEAKPDTRPLSEVDPLDLAGAIDPTTQQTARWHYGPNAPAHKARLKGTDSVIPTNKKD